MKGKAKKKEAAAVEGKAHMLEMCPAQIMILFNRDDPEYPLAEFCEALAREDIPEEAEMLERWIESNQSRLPRWLQDAIFERGHFLMQNAFAVGYVLGQEFDICNEEIRKVAADLKRRLMESGAFPEASFQRREKKEPQPFGKGRCADAR